MEAEQKSITENGVKIGIIDADNTKVTFDKDYNYFAFYPLDEGAIVMESITINYRDPKPANVEDIPAFEEGFALTSDDVENLGLHTPRIPYHEDWIAKYELDGVEGIVENYVPAQEEEVAEEENGENSENEESVNYLSAEEEVPADAPKAQYTEEGLYLPTELTPASYHNLKIWYEHYYHGTKTEPKECHHVTALIMNLDKNGVESREEASKVYFTEGTLGEGVHLELTLTGLTGDDLDNMENPEGSGEEVQNPEENNPEDSDPAPANNIVRRLQANDGIYILESTSDLTEPLQINSVPAVVQVSPTLKQQLDLVKVSAVAVHDATGTRSNPVEMNVFDTVTGVEEIEAAEVADGEVLYFTLQGVRVNNPEKGIYIRLVNNKAEKVVIR